MILDNLEWLARYGFIDIIFGIGVIGFLARLVKKAFPSNYDHLHINVKAGGPASIPGAKVDQTLNINLRNAGQTNFYIARAYFRPKLRRWWFLWVKKTYTKLKVHPLSHRIADMDAFELKFKVDQAGFCEYEALVQPGHNNGQTTWLALEEPSSQRDINKRLNGVLYIEYATSGRQGLHRTRI